MKEIMDNLDAWIEPSKRENMRALCETLPEVIHGVLAGKEYTDDEIKETPLYKRYYRHMSVKDKPKHWVERFRQYEFHIKSIRDVGILNPIHLVKWRGRHFIYRGFKRVVIAHTLGIPTLRAVIVTPDTPRVRGRRLSQVLDELRAEGLTFIYNTHILPADLLVAQEPAARHGLALAREILAARGLGLLQAAPGVYAVTVTPQPQPAPSGAAPGTAPVEEVIVQPNRYSLAADTAVGTFLTQEQVTANAKTYAEQAFRVLDPKRTIVRENGEWLSKLTFAEVIGLAAHRLKGSRLAMMSGRLLQPSDGDFRMTDGRKQLSDHWREP